MLKIGILGLPCSGKTTVYNALTGSKVQTGVPSTPLSQKNISVVNVPDARLEHLRGLYNPKKFTLSQVEYNDYPGLPVENVKGKGELVAAMREVDSLVVVIRAFETDLVEQPLDVAGDLATIEAEMILYDMEQIEKRVEKLEVSTTKPSKTQDHDKRELAALRKCKAHVEAEKPLVTLELAKDERDLLRSFRFFTEKPRVLVVNTADTPPASELLEKLKKSRGVLHVMNAKIEEELVQLSEEDRISFMKDFGVSEPSRDAVIRESYEAAGLCSFFTVGEDEVRAWTIRKGDDAVTAAGKIHTDIARGFIRAEVVAYDDIKAYGDMKGAKAAGKLRLEGKEYLVKDGDIINFRFSV